VASVVKFLLVDREVLLSPASVILAVRGIPSCLTVHHHMTYLGGLEILRHIVYLLVSL
jgi:hypothetical protein